MFEELLKNLNFFSQNALNDYRINSHDYEIMEDDYGGVIWNYSRDENSNDNSWATIRYGYRKMYDQSLCIAAYIPDLRELPKEDRIRWKTYELENHKYAKDDEPFNTWVRKFLGAESDIDIRPLTEVFRQIRLINSITTICMGICFFKGEENPSIPYPSSENTEEYLKSITNLYRRIIDDMNKEAIEILADKLSISLTDPVKKMNSFKEILPDELIDIHKGFQNLYYKRQKVHGTKNQKSKKFPSFETFREDLIKLQKPLSDLIVWLENIFDVDAYHCLDRVGKMTLFPKVKRTKKVKRMYERVKETEGKTIDKIEFGELNPSPNAHKSDGLILHFTDGTSMSVNTGSNAWNLSVEREDLRPDDFHTDLMFFWAPAVKRKSDPETSSG